MAASSHGKHRNHTETRKIKKIGWMEPMYYPPPSPTQNPRKTTEYTKRGTGAEERKLFFFYLGVREGDFGAEPDAVEISYLLRSISVSR